MKNDGARIVWLMAIIILGITYKPCFAKVYTVGDSAGWAVNVDYTTWASGKTFKVGDSLVFNYGSSHTVDEVGSRDYGTCTAGNSIASYNSGPTTVALNATGTRYFICGVAGHCTGGMKLSVPIAGRSSSGTSTPAATSPASFAPSISDPFVASVFSVVAFWFNLFLS